MTDAMAEGAHGEGCGCVRCRGFERGNGVAVKHGAHAPLLLRPRADELMQALLAAIGDRWEPRFDAAVAATAMVGARLERAMAALDEAAKPGDLASLETAARGWMRQWFTALAALGLTP